MRRERGVKEMSTMQSGGDGLPGRCQNHSDSKRITSCSHVGERFVLWKRHQQLRKRRIKTPTALQRDNRVRRWLPFESGGQDNLEEVNKGWSRQSPACHSVYICTHGNSNFSAVATVRLLIPVNQ